MLLCEPNPHFLVIRKPPMAWGDEEHQQAVARRMRWLRAAKGFWDKPWSEWEKHNGGVDYKTWLNWEAGTRMPSLPEAAKVCGATGVSLNWIFNEQWGDVSTRTADELRSTTAPEHPGPRAPGRPRKAPQQAPGKGARLQ